MNIRKIFAAASAAAVAVLSLTTFSTSAAAEYELSYTVNDYGILSTYVHSGLYYETFSGDYDPDDSYNSVDMVVLKRYLLGFTSIPDGPPVVEETLIEAPLKKFDRTTPSLGEAKICVFRVTFPDCDYANSLSAEEMDSIVFGGDNYDSMFYPFESLSAYYDRASYGNLALDGDIYPYTAKYNRSHYSNGEGFEKLFMEALSYYDSFVDFSQYDKNNDGFFDGISVSVPLDGINAEEDAKWWGFQNSFYYNYGFGVDNTRVKAYIVNDAQPRADSMDYYIQVLAHELAHSMGLPDYYKYNSSDSEGMHGSAGGELMDDMSVDLSSFSKLMLGWLTDKDVQLASAYGGKQEFVLNDASKEGSCLIIPVGELDDNYFSEYFLVEYMTKTNNNSRMWTMNGFVRILHISAEVITSPYNRNYKIFKYENYSPDYDDSDNGERVISLVNDGNGAFITGNSIDYGTKNFGAYDGNGQQTIDPGFSVYVGEMGDGECHITINP